jgi:hypothetical protein
MATSKALVQAVIPDETIISKIYFIRGQKVMLDVDLAALYQVETKQLKRQVRRNIARFPEDFMFELTIEEFENLRSQFGTSSWGGARYLPMAFTEQEVSMLSGVLNSPVSIQVHIQIIRIFTRMRKLLLTNKDILLQLKKMEKDVKDNKQDIAMIFKALKQLLDPPKQKRRLIGFKREEEEE